MRTLPSSQKPILAPAGNPGADPADCADGVWAKACDTTLAAAAAAPVARTLRRLESIIGFLPVFLSYPVHAIGVFLRSPDFAALNPGYSSFATISNATGSLPSSVRAASMP